MPSEPVLANGTAYEPHFPQTRAPTHPALSSADDSVPALLQSLIGEFKGLQEGLEVHQKALAVKASSKYEARMTVDAPYGAPHVITTGRGSTLLLP
jgi:hypothetical protein